MQCGTPEDLVLSPATDYVREFTRAVPKSKVVRLASLMTKGHVPDGLPSLPAEATVAEAGPSFLSGAAQIAVTQAGRPVGLVQREDVIRLLLGGEA